MTALKMSPVIDAF